MRDEEALGLGATMLESQDKSPEPRPAIGLTMRATVLPRRTRSASSATTASTATPRFEPTKLLGRGGLGEVTLAQDNDIGRPVALKRLRADAQSEEHVHRFVEEIRTVGQLDHPNIAPIHDVGIDDQGQHYFVMRYIEGETLESVIAKLAAGDADYHRRYTFEHRVQIFLGILHAIQYAHSRQIIHRDLKPSNIMIGPYGEVVVMDWGIAKKKTAADQSVEALGHAATLDPVNAESRAGADSLFRTRHGSLVGTPAYMSPEQAGGRVGAIDERSDVYSLCVVFYELLALVHYLPGRTTVHEMLASVLKDDHELAPHLDHPYQGRVPAELGWFIEKGLAKDPKDRYQSVAEMSDQLQRVLAGGFQIQCYVTLMKRGGSSAVRFADGHPRIALSAIVLVLAVFVFGLVAVVRLAFG